MPIAINEFEAVADRGTSSSGGSGEDGIDRRPIEPQRLKPALARLATRARRTWAH